MSIIHRVCVCVCFPVPTLRPTRCAPWLWGPLLAWGGPRLQTPDRPQRTRTEGPTDIMTDRFVLRTPIEQY